MQRELLVAGAGREGAPRLEPVGEEHDRIEAAHLGGRDGVLADRRENGFVVDTVKVAGELGA